MDDRELISRYVERREPGAFAELMGRHVGMVYAAARRQVGDAHLAEDVAQAVFIILERKAAQVRDRGTVAGWLLNATHFAAREALRRERRLKRRERVVMEGSPMGVTTDEGTGAWEDVRPVLDKAMARLGAADRDAVALRFLQSKSLAEVGAAMGVSEEAARKRVGRALEKLREILAGRGVTVESAMLAGLMSAHGTERPAAVAGTGAGAAISKGAMVMMQGTKVKAAAAGLAVLLLLGGGGLYFWKAHPSQLYPGPPPVTAGGQAPGQQGTAGVGALGWDGAMQGQFATAGCVDARGRIWVGGEEQGLWLYQGGTQWRHVTTADGLGEDGAFAVAADLGGRVWVGHLRHGVSVYDGTRWKNYDALTGPLGQHVFRIAVCPKGSPRGAGDVWIATEVGLARYSASKDTWSYVTRAEGLPSDQVGAMAFDGEGNLYAGTLCDGLLIAGPGDDYATWRRVRGAERAPLAAAGEGLPSDTINAVATTADGTVFVGTNRGLARSADHGDTWTFARGADWVDKVRGSIDGPPAGWSPDGRAALAEDYVASLAADDAGLLWVGYRTKGYQCLDPKTLAVVAEGGGKGADYCAMILPVPGMAPLVGTRGFGLTQAEGAVVGAGVPAGGAEGGPRGGQLPSPATPPSPEELRNLARRVRNVTSDEVVAAYLGEDWATQGDWVGRYGRQQAVWPAYGAFAPAGTAYALAVAEGPHNKNDSGHGWTYFADLDSKSPKALYAPGRGRRIIGEWNDGSWQGKKFGPTWEGPDLWLDVTVPPGTTRVSLYTFNVTGGSRKADRRRDYGLEVRRYAGTVAESMTGPVLARARTVASENPAYRSFLLGGGRYWIRMAGNYSFVVSLSGVYFDRMGPGTGEDATAHYLQGVEYAPPAAAGSGSDQATAAQELWASLDQAWGRAGAVGMQAPYRVLAYRAALAGGASADVLANWRWALHLWTTGDRAEWGHVMAESKKRLPAAATRVSNEE